MRPMAGIPLKNTLRDFGRMWRQSPLDMTEDERLHLWDAAFAVAWQRERFRDSHHASLVHVEVLAKIAPCIMDFFLSFNIWEGSMFGFSLCREEQNHSLWTLLLNDVFATKIHTCFTLLGSSLLALCV